MKNVNKINNFKVKLVLFNNGERFPLLIDNKTNQPDYWSTLYSITQLRAKGRAVETMRQTIRNIMLFKIILYRLNLNEKKLEQRFKEGWILHLYEIEKITEQCKLFIKDILNNSIFSSSSKFFSTSLEKHRAKSPNKIFNTVNSNVFANRVRDIRDFLDWWINAKLSKLNIGDPVFKELAKSKKYVKENLTSRIPNISKNNSFGEREGLSDKDIKLLLNMTKHDSAINPWKSEFAKIRNELLFIWLLQFGLRRGELLNLKITDINFQEETFFVFRRADDPNDPRKDQPSVKTRGRKLAIPKKIADLTFNFIINHRAKLPQAKTHEFLFVADKTGQPLSKVAVNKVFEKLRNANDTLPRNLSPHTCRHTWNDAFSKLMDEKNIPEEMERKIRSNAMGWSPTSDTAITYTKRHINKKANEVILQMFEKSTNEHL